MAFFLGKQDPSDFYSGLYLFLLFFFGGGRLYSLYLLLILLFSFINRNAKSFHFSFLKTDRVEDDLRGKDLGCRVGPTSELVN